MAVSGKKERFSRILVTGSSGLIGAPLCEYLERDGHEVVRFDIAQDSKHDIRNRAALETAMRGCGGVIHLAAISRVADAERDPGACETINVGGTRNVVEAALAAKERPWLLFSSSREVYGQPQTMPVSEDSPVAPYNTYGRSKAAGEKVVLNASRQGLRTAILRLTNVYGGLNDHKARVIPAFVRASLANAPLRVEGPNATFDFVHVDDCVAAFAKAITLLEAGEKQIGPFNVACGRATTLGELARLVVSRAHSKSEVAIHDPLKFNVSRFVGDPARAERALGWKHAISLEAGLDKFIALCRAEGKK